MGIFQRVNRMPPEAAKLLGAIDERTRNQSVLYARDARQSADDHEEVKKGIGLVQSDVKDIKLMVVGSDEQPGLMTRMTLAEAGIQQNARDNFRLMVLLGAAIVPIAVKAAG
jgi:hypothetical protein